MNLHDCLAGMVGVERSLLADVIQWTEGGISDPRVAATGEQLEQTVQGHLAALELRLVDPDSSEGPVVAPLPFPAIDSTAGRNHSVRALHGWYTGVNHARFGYAVLHLVAHRYFDSEGEESAAELAERHLRAYTAVARQIEHLLCDVVVAELEATNDQCRCQCPACSLGVCVCAPHGTKTIELAWQESAPPASAPGIVVRPPRTGSAAARAGLTAGDRLVSVGGEPLPTDLDVPVLQTALRQRKPGETVDLDVRRNGEAFHAALQRS